MDCVDAKKMSERIESNPNTWHSKTLKEKMINVLNQSFIAKDFCLNAFDNDFEVISSWVGPIPPVVKT